MKRATGYIRFSFNTKRKIKSLVSDDIQQYREIADRVDYGGNPEHKKNPGDFGLTPPCNPRAGKSLCDVVSIFSRKAALELLKSGLLRGMVSERRIGTWPQNIWSVTEEGHPLEAQLENPEKGVYHGYPMPESDPFAAEVIIQWKSRENITKLMDHGNDNI